VSAEEPRASKPRFPSGYGLTGKQPLPWSWAVERLAASRNYWIVTTRADGRAHAMPVWGLWHDDAVVFSSAPSSLKARNITREPRIVVHLESGDEVVILEGAAERIALDAALADAYKAKYSFRPDPNDPNAFWVSLRPSRAFAWLESSYPDTATRFDWV
jgi:general stress protein 26